MFVSLHGLVYFAQFLEVTCFYGVPLFLRASGAFDLVLVEQAQVLGSAASAGDSLCHDVIGFPARFRLVG